MTQQRANEIFETSLGEQSPSIFCTSDDAVFLRRREAVAHAAEVFIETLGEFDTSITEWYPENCPEYWLP